MTHGTFDDHLLSFLDDGPRAAPADLVPDVLVELPGIRQRSALRVRLGSQPVPAVATVLAVVLVASAALVLARPAGVATPVPTPAPSVAVTPAPSGVPLVTMPPASLWVTFESVGSGYRFEVPRGWTTEAADREWPYGEATTDASPWLDRITATDERLTIFGRATRPPEPLTLDGWVAAYEDLTDTCGAGEWTTFYGSAMTWRVREVCGRMVGLAVAGERAFVLSLRPLGVQASPEQVAEDRELFERVLRTFIAKLSPESRS